MDSMDDQGQPVTPVTAGDRLRFAREVAGLSRSDVASRTKIAERHLLAIEENRFGDLAARTYAVGFARAYARSIGLDEAEIAALVRNQLDSSDVERPAPAPSFEPGDPARVPPVRLAWVAAGGAVVVIVLLLVFWGSFLSPEGKLPDLLPESTPAPAVAKPAVRRAPPVPVAGPVVLTATDDGVWLAVTDAEGNKLIERTLAKGESRTLPIGVPGLELRTGRPEAIRVTVGGTVIPPLSDKPATMSGISLAPADLLARARPGAGVIQLTPAATPTASAPTVSAPSGAVTPAARQTSQPAPARTQAPAVRPAPRQTVRPTPSPAATAAVPAATAAPAAPPPSEPPAAMPVPQ